MSQWIVNTFRIARLFILSIGCWGPFLTTAKGEANGRVIHTNPLTPRIALLQLFGG